MFKKIALVCLVSLMSFQAKAQEKKTQIYLDDSQPIELRVEDALSKMTLEEKENLSQLIQKYPHLTFIFQPVSPLQKRDMKKVLEIFWGFVETHRNASLQLIPQVHKFLGVL